MIYKRESYMNPLATVNLWVIPTFTYSMLKYVAKTTFTHEWVWWIVIPFMFTLWFFINFKIGRKPKPAIAFDYDLVFDVERFNKWWNDEANGATYAHPGIYLRLDKLSLSHVTEYLYKAHGLSLSEHYTYDEANEFYNEIRSNWYEQI